MRLVLPGPNGPVDAGSTRRSLDLGRLAREAAARMYGSEAVDIALLVDQPPWLQPGMIVRQLSPPEDPGEATAHPYAQVVGFLPVGGVLVVHPETGVAVFPPEDLVVCNTTSIDPRIVREIAALSGIAPLAE